MQKPIKYKKRKKRANRSALILLFLALAAVITALVVGIIAIARAVGGNDPEPTETAADTENISVTETEPETEPETEEVTEEPIIRPEGVCSDQNYYACEADLSACRSEEELAEAAAKLRAAGYTAAVVTAKNENGSILYASDAETAKACGAIEGELTARRIVSLLHREGLFVTVRICCFHDNLAASADPEMALLNNGGKPWSDGSSRWLSVYSGAACDYICELCAEWEAAGADEISLSAFSLPLANDSHLIRYGGDDHFAAVESFLTSVSLELSEAKLTLEAEPSALAAGRSLLTGADFSVLRKFAVLFVADCREDTLSGFAESAAALYPVRPQTTNGETGEGFIGKQKVSAPAN